VSLSPIVNLAHRQSRLPRLFFFSSNLFAKQQEQKKRSERQFNSPPKKPSFPAPPPGHFLPSPFASPRIFFLSLNCQRVVRDVPPPTFPLPSSRALKQNLSAVHLRDLFFFPDPFCLHPLHVSRLTQQVQTTRPQLVHFFCPCRTPIHCICGGSISCECSRRRFFSCLIGSWSRAQSEPPLLQMSNLVILRQVFRQGLPRWLGALRGKSHGLTRLPRLRTTRLIQ
jgi:hypothetical protein